MEIAIIALAAASQVFSNQFYYIDDKFTAISVVYVAWTLAFVLAFVRLPSAARLAWAPEPVRRLLARNQRSS